MQFQPGQDYNNVYFMSVDAKGHSNVVATNDADKADHAFDTFEEIAHRAVDEVVSRTRCCIAEFWGWAGDGGLCIFFDPDESKARSSCLSAAEIILQEIPHCNQVIQRNGVNGEIHVRVALHKGHIRYKGDSNRGSVHSKDLNFCAHLEKKIPGDTIGISDDIYSILGGEKQKFVEASGKFESRTVYLRSNRTVADVQNEWRQNIVQSSNSSVALRSDLPAHEIGLSGAYSQRALTKVFFDHLENATGHVWVMGVGLGGFQLDHKNQLKELCKKGLDVRMLALEPQCELACVTIHDRVCSLPAWRDEEANSGSYNARNVQSLHALVEDVNREVVQSPHSRPIQLRYYRTIPGFALLIVDSILFFSPYVVDRPNLKLVTFEAVAGGRIYDQFEKHFLKVWASDDLSRPNVD